MLRITIPYFTGKQVINVLDEAQRLMEVTFYDMRKGKGSSQGNSHTMSYLGARNQYKELGDIMGLEDNLGFLAYIIKNLDALVKKD